jgi:hypothetical protein
VFLPLSIADPDEPFLEADRIAFTQSLDVAIAAGAVGLHL